SPWRHKVICHPLSHALIAYIHLVLRVAVVLVEIPDVEGVLARHAVVLKAGAAMVLPRASDSLAAGGGFPRRDLADRVAFQLHRFCFVPPWIVAGAAVGIGNSGFVKEPVRHCVAPYLCLA